MSRANTSRYVGTLAAALITASGLAACGGGNTSTKAGTGANINVYNGDSGNIVRNFNPFIGYTDCISALQIMKQQLKGVGIDFNYQELSYASFTTKEHTGDFQLVIDAAYGGPGPYYLYNYMLNSKTTAPIGQQATSNYSRFRDPAVDKLLADASGTQDPQNGFPTTDNPYALPVTWSQPDIGIVAANLSSS